MTREDIKYWLYYYGMPKEFVDNCAEQIERDFKKALSLPEQPVEGLEEAAGQYLENHKPLTRYNWGDLMDAFIAGAEWMKSKYEK